MTPCTALHGRLCLSMSRCQLEHSSFSLKSEQRRENLKFANGPSERSTTILINSPVRLVFVLPFLHRMRALSQVCLLKTGQVGAELNCVLQSELDETQNALQAAQRLSEQLDKKTEAIAALKEEG